jgi:hypothetical protein
MRLVAYRRSEDLPLVDAVFADRSGYLHAQLVDAPDAEDARIQFALSPQMPDLGGEVSGHEEIARAGSGPDARLDLEMRWHQLIANAFSGPDGATAVLRFVLDDAEIGPAGREPAS